MAPRDHRNGMKNQGKSQIPQPEQNGLAKNRDQKQPGQDLRMTEAGGPLKEQSNENRESEQD